MRCDSPPDKRRRRTRPASGNPDRHRRGIAGDCGPRAAIRRRPAVAAVVSCSVLKQRQRLAERQAHSSPSVRAGRSVPNDKRQAAASSRRREPWQVEQGDFADQMIEPLAIGGADARRLVDGREQSLVLESAMPAARGRCLRSGSALSRSTPRRCRAGWRAAAARSSSSNGVSSEKPACRANASAKRGNEHSSSRSGHAASAPSRSERRRIADEQGRGGTLLHAQSLARRTPAERTVERKMMRIQRLEAAAALIAGEVLAVALDVPIRLRLARPRRERRASRRGRDRGRFHRIGDARPLVGRARPRDRRRLRRDACGDDRCSAVPRRCTTCHRRACARSRCGESRRRASRTSPDRAVRAGPSDTACSLPAATESCSMISSAVCVPMGIWQAGQYGCAEPGVQDAQVIVNLRDGADGRARAFAGRLLFDADGRRQAADVLDLRLLHLAEELPGVGRQRFDVAPLSFGVDRVQRQRAFAGAAGAAADASSARAATRPSRFFRLCCCAPCTVSMRRSASGSSRFRLSSSFAFGLRPFAVRVPSKIGTQRLPRVRVLALGDLLPVCRRTTISPPPLPPSGPRSISQSAVLMTSRLCSMTTTVLPASTKPCSTCKQLAGCRRSAGPSSAHRECTACVPVARRHSSRASLMRCASPPESVGDGWPSLM